MTIKRAIKMAYAGTGAAAVLLLAAKQPMVLGVLILIVLSCFGAILFLSWVLAD